MKKSLILQSPATYEHYLNNVFTTQAHSSFTTASLKRIRFGINAIRSLYVRQNQPWIVPYSAGRNGYILAQMIFQALSGIDREQLTKPIHFVNVQTGTDLPFLKEQTDLTFHLIDKQAKKWGLPVETHVTQPDAADTFWVSLLGHGFPPPKTDFQWCCEKMKIKPVVSFIKNKTQTEPHTIIYDSVATHSMYETTNDIPESHAFFPLRDISPEDLWEFMTSVPYSPWGEKNATIQAFYEKISNHLLEIPYVLMVDEWKDQQGVCGKMDFDFHFPCWNCPLMKYHESLHTFMENGQYDWLVHLFGFQHELYQTSFNEELRTDHTNRQRTYQAKKNIDDRKDYNGRESETLTLAARQELLASLLKRQRTIQSDYEIPYELISAEETAAIQTIWKQEEEAACTLSANN